MAERIINLTQHQATPEQKDSGVFDLPDDLRQELITLLTFNSIPTREDLIDRASRIAGLASRSGALTAMIGGAPYLMPHLETALLHVGIKPTYAFSVRESIEKHNPDGTVTKTNVFRHVGFVQ